MSTWRPSPSSGLDAAGRNWDALALITLPNGPDAGIMLAEGKSYPYEMLKGTAAGATDANSKRTIEKVLAWTQGTVGIPQDVGAWSRPLYQNANRLAHVYWLRSRGVRAWLVHLLFTDDPHGPTSRVEWENALKEADRRLGLTGGAIDAAAHVLLPAGNREELLA